MRSPRSPRGCSLAAAGWRAQAPASARRLQAEEKRCLLGSPARGAGQGARLLRRPPESWPHRPSSPEGEAPRPAGSPRPWAAGCRRGERGGRAQRGHSAALERGVPGSSFTPASPSWQGCGEENETRLKSPCSDLRLQPPPRLPLPPHHHHPFS